MKNSPLALLFFAVVLIQCTTETKTPNFIVEELASPTDSVSGEPYLFTDQLGVAYLSWIEKTKETNYLKFSKWEKETWSTPVTITSGPNWFVNWADYPMLSSNGQNLMAHFLAKSGESTYAYDVNIIQSSDDGNTWSDSFVLHDDGMQAEHGFVSMVPFENNFFISWLDGRNTAMSGAEGHEGHDGHHGTMTIRAAVMDAYGKKSGEWELDNKVCDCCQTTAAITANGPVVIYRDRSDDEIRDMSIVRLIDDKWTEPKSVFNDHWNIKGCPVNGPRADALNNNLIVAWFTAADNKPLVNVIFSTDGGASFGDPIRIDDGKAIGRVDVLWYNEEVAFVSWMEGADIRVVSVTKEGIKGEPIAIASSSEKRASGFPQMTLVSDDLLFAWTSTEEKSIRVTKLSRSE